MRKFMLALAATAALCPVAMADDRTDGSRYDLDVGSPMEFHMGSSGGNCDGCEFVIAEGVITADTAKRFEVFLRQHEPRGLISLNSPGGSVVDALIMGEMIRASNLSTIVGKSVGTQGDDGSVLVKEDQPGQCASACVLLFASGVQRFGLTDGFHPTARIGVHQFFVPAARDEPEKIQFSGLERSRDQVLTGVVLEYLTRMGVSTALWTIATGVSPWQEMHWLTEQEMIETKLVTERPAETVLKATGEGGLLVQADYSGMRADYTAFVGCDLQHRAFLTIFVAYRSDLSDVEMRELVDATWWRDLKVNGESDLVLQEAKGLNQRTLQLAYLIPSLKIEDLRNWTKFEISKWDGARYEWNSAAELSFEFPAGFNGMRALPKACLE